MPSWPTLAFLGELAVLGYADISFWGSGFLCEGIHTWQPLIQHLGWLLPVLWPQDFSGLDSQPCWTGPGDADSSQAQPDIVAMELGPCLPLRGKGTSPPFCVPITCSTSAMPLLQNHYVVPISSNEWALA